MSASTLIYNYAVGRMSSRQIEKATYEDVALRYICGGDAHPDPDTICAFRCQNARLFQECFVKVLEKDQYNFTDPESRIMKAGNGAHFEFSSSRAPETYCSALRTLKTEISRASSTGALVEPSAV